MTDWMEPVAFGDNLGREQATDMLSFYCRTLSNLGYSPHPFKNIEAKVGGNIYSAGKFEVMNHALWMCDETAKFIQQNRLAKAYRWLGMIQGILFMGGVFSISDLKEHNAKGIGK